MVPSQLAERSGAGLAADAALRRDATDHDQNHANKR